MKKINDSPYFSGKTRTFLPIQHRRAHDLCFILHDIMLEHLVSGMSIYAFTKEFVFRDNDDKRAFEMADDIFQWMEHSRRDEEKISLLVTLVVPAVLGDMLNCIYEALEASRKGKMAVAFMLLRKPLQEGLFLLEAILADKADFAAKLSSAPTLLWSQGAGGLEVHTNRINKVLDKIGERHRFDANYLAELRYDKSTGDGFDGICNQAMHLFTKHKSIETKPLNVNFVFVSEETHHSQWNYIYSRLPYIMVYLHKIVEHICHDIMPTDPVYLAQIERVIAASILLWWPNVTAQYGRPEAGSGCQEDRDLAGPTLQRARLSDAICKRYRENGSTRLLSRRDRSGGPKKIQRSDAASTPATAC